MTSGIRFLILSCIWLATGQASALDNQAVTGIWQGWLSLSGGDVRIVFKIETKVKGILSATMDSPDQGTIDVPVNKVQFNDRSLLLISKRVAGRFTGKLLESGQIEGTWTQLGQSFPLVLEKIEQAPKNPRPQEPKKPYPYLEEQVTFSNAQAKVRIAGILTYPKAKAQYPAVILVSGSGPQDRDGTCFGHRPLLVLAGYLTRRGIAVLRVDDRGVGGSSGRYLDATLKDRAGDILAGIDYLKKKEQIDPRRIGLIGHSEGGWVASLAASQRDDIAFLVLMATPGVNGKQVLRSQSRRILQTIKAKEETIKRQLDCLDQIFQYVDGANSKQHIKQKLQVLLKETMSHFSDSEKAALGVSDAGIERQIRQIQSRWFYDFINTEPRTFMANVSCPVLILQGERDLQVEPHVNLQALEQVFKQAGPVESTFRRALGTFHRAGNTQVTIKVFPELNHLFQTADTGLITEYARIKETIAPSVLQTIAQWIIQ